MADDTGKLRIEEDSYVNEATLELLQRRIESHVRTNFLKTITIPVGGGGIAAILVAVFLWIPKQIESFLNQPTVQAAVDANINGQIDAYFKSEQTQNEMQKKIQRVTSAQIEAEVTERLPSVVGSAVESAVKNYFSDGDGGELVTATVRASAENFLTGTAGKAQIQQLVNSYMETTGRQLLIEKVDEVMRPAVETASKSLEEASRAIAENSRRLILEFDPQSLTGEMKRDRSKLDEYLSPRSVKEKREKGLPIVLTKTIRSGNRYDRQVIRDYVNGFSEKFPELFQYISVSYATKIEERGRIVPDHKQEKLIALIPVNEFRAKFDRIADEFVELLNSAKRGEALSTEAVQQVRHKLAGWFGEHVVKTIPQDSRVDRVLRSRELWSSRIDLDDRIAVVDSHGRLSAVTTRRQMISGLIDYPSTN